MSVQTFLNDIANAYNTDIVKAGKEAQLIILVAFLGAFGVVRFITHSIRAQRFGLKNIDVKGRHIHHLVWGIFLLLITGYLGIAFSSRPAQDVVAFFFGIGAALTLDEFALWLNLKDDYWSKEGRRSVDAVIIAASIFGLVLLGFSFWVDITDSLGKFISFLLNI